MFQILLYTALILFLLHVILLLAAFPNAELARKRYFYSHLTLWLTGIVVLIMAILYRGTGRSGFFDYFDTTLKIVMIPVFTAALSFVAHLIVKSVVLPMMSKK